MLQHGSGEVRLQHNEPRFGGPMVKSMGRRAWLAGQSTFTQKELLHCNGNNFSFIMVKHLISLRSRRIKCHVLPFIKKIGRGYRNGGPTKTLILLLGRFTLVLLYWRLYFLQRGDQKLLQFLFVQNLNNWFTYDQTSTDTILAKLTITLDN